MGCYSLRMQVLVDIMGEESTWQFWAGTIKELLFWGAIATILILLFSACGNQPVVTREDAWTRSTQRRVSDLDLALDHTQAMCIEDRHGGVKCNTAHYVWGCTAEGCYAYKRD